MSRTRERGRVLWGEEDRKCELKCGMDKRDASGGNVYKDKGAVMEIEDDNHGRGKDGQVSEYDRSPVV